MLKKLFHSIAILTLPILVVVNLFGLGALNDLKTQQEPTALGGGWNQRVVTNEVVLMDAKATTGVGTIMNVDAYETVTVTMNSASSANLTIKAAGALLDNGDLIDFTAAQSATNNYEFLAMVDLEDSSQLDGDTGLVLAGTDDNRMFEINVNGIKWLNFRVTARSAGSITVKAKGFGS